MLFNTNKYIDTKKFLINLKSRELWSNELIIIAFLDLIKVEIYKLNL